MESISYDTETTGLDLHRGKRMFSYSTCSEKGDIGIYRLDGPQVRQIKSQQFLDKIWADGARKLPKVMHNAKFDITATEYRLNKELVEDHAFHDTIAQSHILQNHHPTHRLKDLGWEICNIPKDDEEAVKEVVKEGGDYSMVPEELMDEYQYRDAERTMLLHLILYPKIKANPKYLEIYNMELDLIKTTLRMEERGVMLNFKKCRELVRQLEYDVDQVLNQIERYAGVRINPNKPAEKEWLLFEKAALPILERTKKLKKPKTTKEVFAKLYLLHPHPILAMILKYDSWSRGITTLQSYQELADADGILHPNIKTTGARNSRESCSNPNLQNVAKEGVLLNPYPIPARRVFQPRPGFVNFHIDFSGIEFRLGVFFSREPLLMKMILNGEDGHAFAASTFYRDRFKKSQGSRKKTLRNAAKNGNFLILYSGSFKALSKTLGLELKEAKRAFTDYAQAVPRYCNLNKEVMEEVRETGRVTTAFGRTLHIPRNQAYKGCNYLVSGTAAGVLKRAQNRVHKYLQEATGGEAKILLPIHDEIVIEYPRNMLGEAKHIFRRVRELMIDFPEFDIPLEVDVEVATVNWADKVEFDLAA